MIRLCARGGLVLWMSLVSAACGSYAGTVTIINSADEPISLITFKMSSGETQTVMNLEPSSRVTITYRVPGDAGYSVEVVFLSGKRLMIDDTYVTRGVDYQDQIIVTASEMKATRKIINRW
jgi:hypothetical protein